MEKLAQSSTWWPSGVHAEHYLKYSEPARYLKHSELNMNQNNKKDHPVQKKWYRCIFYFLMQIRRIISLHRIIFPERLIEDYKQSNILPTTLTLSEWQNSLSNDRWTGRTVATKCFASPCSVPWRALTRQRWGTAKTAYSAHSHPWAAKCPANYSPKLVRKLSNKIAKIQKMWRDVCPDGMFGWIVPGNRPAQNYRWQPAPTRRSHSKTYRSETAHKP